MAKLLDPLIKSGVVPPESVFTADFAKKCGGDNDKILMMPGPTWYAQGHLRRRRCTVPAGELTAALPLRWNNEPLVDRPGRRRSVDRLQAHEEHGGCHRLREVGHDDERGEGTSAGGTRRTGPPRTVQLNQLIKDPYFAAPPRARR